MADQVEKTRAARETDPIIHTSMFAEICSQVVQAVVVGAAVIAVTAAVAAAAPAIAAAAAGTAACTAVTAVVASTVGSTVISAGASLAVGGLMSNISPGGKSLSNWLSDGCDSLFNALIPPTEYGKIAEGSPDTNTNDLRSARAAGYYVDPNAVAEPEPEAEPNTLGNVASFVAGMIPGVGEVMSVFGIIESDPLVAAADPGTEPADHDEVQCDRHSPAPPVQVAAGTVATGAGVAIVASIIAAPVAPLAIAGGLLYAYMQSKKHTEYIAQGSKEVYINSQPAARDSEKTTCDATINKDAPTPNIKISTDVLMGGESVTVREIHSGKSKIGQLIGMVASIFIARKIAQRIARSRGCAGKPVSVTTGTKILGFNEDLDFSLPGLIPIVWQREYDSYNASQNNGLFGGGWSTQYENAIERVPHPDGGDLYVYINEEGNRLELGKMEKGTHFISPINGLFFYQIDTAITVVEDINTGLYQLFDQDPITPNRSRLIALSDRNQNTLQLTYDIQGRLEFLKDPLSDLTIHLSYQSKHIQRVSSIERLYFDSKHTQIEKIERLVSYNYTDSGYLSEVKDPTGYVLRSFTYNQQGLMISHTLPTGNQCHYEWQLFDKPENGPESVTIEGTPYTLTPFLESQPQQEWRVIHHWTEMGEEYHFYYDLEKGETRVVDSLNRTKHYRWDALHDVIQYTDPQGNSWKKVIEAGQLKKEINPDGSEWSYRYDEIGRLIETKDPLGRKTHVKLMQQWALPLVFTDIAGNKTTYQYDKQGNLLTVTNPLNQQTCYTYDGYGRVIIITDPSRKNKYLFWNEFSQLTKYKDCSNFETHYDYNQQNYLTKVINSKLQATTYHYDNRGFLVESILPDGRTEKYTRSHIGQLTALIDPANKSTRYQYDLDGRVINRQDAQDRTVKFDYDPYGRLQSLINENNESYSFEWDNLDRLTIQHELGGTARHYHYNLLDQITGLDYLPSTLDHDDLRQLPAANDHPSPTDKSSAPISVPPICHQLERDAIGRLLKKITSDGVTEYSYNKLDQVTGIVFTDQQGKKQNLNYNYNKIGQLTKETNLAGSIKYAYDELGNIEQINLPDGRQLNHLYYGSGHLHQINLNGLVITDFERNDLHQEVLRTQGRLNTRTGYDATNRLTEKQICYHDAPKALQALLHKEYEYDASDNLIIQRLTQTQRIKPTSQTEQADKLGHKLTQEPTYNQNSQTPEIIGRFYGVDAANEGSSKRTAIQFNSLGSTASTAQYYNYDSTGRIQQSYQHTIDGQYSNYEMLNYDAAANLLDSNQGQGYVKYNRVYVYQDKRYHYDCFGRLAEKRIGGHTIQHFKYDAEHRIIEITHTEKGQTKLIQFKYDPIGRRIEKAIYLENNLEKPIAKTEFHWQGLKLLKEIQNGLPSLYIYENLYSYAPLARIDGEPDKEQIYYFHTNLAGLPEQLTDQTGNTVWQAEYKIWGNTETEWKDNKTNFEQNLRYQGQYLDRETELHYNTFRYYDPGIGRFTQPDPIGLLGGLNLYQYAPNPIVWIDPWGLADLFDIGTYGGLNGGEHVGDGVQAHELIRHEFLKQQGLAGDSRLSGNPSIALDLDHHTRGPVKDSRGVGGVHYHENQVRSEQGLGQNQFASTIDGEIAITSEAMNRAGVPQGKIATLRQKARDFYNKLVSDKSKSEACGGK